MSLCRVDSVLHWNTTQSLNILLQRIFDVMENIQHILLSEKITEVYVCYDPIFLMST